MVMLTQLARVARLTGYPVIHITGWRTRTTEDERGRPRQMRDIRTITCHHTANGGAKGNYPSLRVVRDGRPGLQGPLAHLGIGRDGTIYVIAAGHANHAGVSRHTDYENSHAIGIEAEAVGIPGTKGDWPAPQMECFARLCAALIAEFDLSVWDVRGHKETCSPPGRKTDPSFGMHAFRDRVASVNLKTKPRYYQQEDDMPTVAEIVAGLRPIIRAEVRAQVIDVLKNEPLIMNKATTAALAADPNAPSALAPVAWFLGNIEFDQDNDRNTTRADRARLEEKMTAVGNLLECVAGHSAEARRLAEQLVASLLVPETPPPVPDPGEGSS